MDEWTANAKLHFFLPVFLPLAGSPATIKDRIHPRGGGTGHGPGELDGAIMM